MRLEPSLQNQQVKELFEAISVLNNTSEAQDFLRDLLTEAEILELSNRLRVARMLTEKVSYVQIEKETGMSSTTIARIKKWLDGGTGGYETILNRLPHHPHNSQMKED